MEIKSEKLDVQSDEERIAAVENVIVKSEMDLSQCSMDSDERQTIMFSDFFHDKHPKVPTGFWMRLAEFLYSKDFDLPMLNREKWVKWPLKMPPKPFLTELSKKYPKFTCGVLSSKEEKKILNRYDELVVALGLDVQDKGRNDLMDRLLQTKSRKSLRFKINVACFVGGRRMLKTRLAIDIWNRLVRLVEKLSNV